MSLNYLCPTPYWHSKVRSESYESIQTELDVAYANTKFEYKLEWGKTHQLSDVTFEEDLLHEHNCLNLLTEINYQMSCFFDAMNFESDHMSYKYIASWFAKFNQGDYAHVHTHLASDFSGVYYYKNTRKHSGLFFQCTNPNIAANIITNPIYGQSEEIAVEQGDMLLFPAYVPHGVKTNETDDDRVSVSFNIMFER